MTLAVASGLILVAGIPATVSSGNVTVTTAHATNPRFDLVAVNNSGTKSVVAGTAAVTPVFPAIPANSVILAAVYVPANDTAIQSNQLVDKRITVSPGHTVADEGSTVAQRPILNFAGSGVTVTDDSGSNRTLVTVPGGGANSVSSLQYVTPTGNDANDGLSWGSPKLTLQSAHDALPTEGGRILASRGLFPAQDGLVVDKAIELRGMGNGMFHPEENGLESVTIFQINAGETGITTTTPNARASYFEGFLLKSLSTEAGEDDGVFNRCHAARYVRVTTHGFGRHGFNNNAGSNLSVNPGGNSNNSRFDQCRAYENFGDGFHNQGSDAQACTYDTCDGSSNGNYNFHFSQCGHNLLVNPHADSGGVGAFYDAASSTVYLQPYSEGGATGQVDIVSGSSGGMWIRTLYASTSTTEINLDATAADSWMIIDRSRFSRQIGLQELEDGGRRYAFTVGIAGAGVFVFKDYTENQQIWQFNGAAAQASRRMQMNVPLEAANGVRIKTKAGAITDSDFSPFTPVNGDMGLDTTNNRLYVRSGGTWRYAALT
ncbi:MAG TPA: hypothetical protein VJ742_12265 [Nitrososphaera sp.]|nr:hypothetical protein [Nitrososphaera sp.]